MNIIFHEALSPCRKLLFPPRPRIGVKISYDEIPAISVPLTRMNGFFNIFYMGNGKRSNQAVYENQRLFSIRLSLYVGSLRPGYLRKS